ncbi:hypothetical protein KSS87_009373 [Heliosperma pusillum]|nr:hypothetical protein KSS87_009373 [Heliosperma pusillum]
MTMIRCSGCTHEYELHRPSVVDEAADFFKRLGVVDFSFDTCRLYGWRCRAKLAVRGSSINPLIGLYQEGTHNVIDIPQCRAHHPSINAAIELLRTGVLFKYGLINLSVFLCLCCRAGKVQVSLVWNSRSETSPSFEKLNALANAFDSLLRKLQKYVPHGSSVADLYGGAGVIGLSLAASKKSRSVKCIEINKDSKHCFEKTVSRLPTAVDCKLSWHNEDASVEPTSWLVGSDVVVVDPPRKGLDESLLHALRTISSAKRKADSPASTPTNLKEEKRPWILRERQESISVESKTIWPESDALPQTLIYISCGWDSFKKDCKYLLSSKAWHLDKAHGFNFFPGTQSIEILAIFKRDPVAKSKKKANKKKLKKP